MGTGENSELAAIVPRRYCTIGIWDRQEESFDKPDFAGFLLSVLYCMI